jgi:hypothetical protein
MFLALSTQGGAPPLSRENLIAGELRQRVEADGGYMEDQFELEIALRNILTKP